jgi:hypothetical protein
VLNGGDHLRFAIMGGTTGSSHIGPIPFIAHLRGTWYAGVVAGCHGSPGPRASLASSAWQKRLLLVEARHCVEAATSWDKGVGRSSQFARRRYKARPRKTTLRHGRISDDPEPALAFASYRPSLWS